MRWSPIEDVTFRGSYTTGYLPPTLDQLTKLEGVLGVDARDPLRGGEPIGIPGPFGNEIQGFYGGNPDVKPETSKTWSVGVILTPRFLSGLRFSADWTRITKNDNYFTPNGLLYATDASIYQHEPMGVVIPADRLSAYDGSTPVLVRQGSRQLALEGTLR